MQKIVKTGEVVLGYKNDILAIYGLGSCIALVIYDPVVKVACMLHVLLPQAPKDSIVTDTKFADSGFKRMMNYLMYSGAKRENLVAKMTGGNNSFKLLPNYQNIGQRNIDACRELLRLNNIRLVTEDVGGTNSRSIFFSLADFDLTIKSENKISRII